MNRREFLRQTGLASAGAFAAPYILPSGRLFARSGNRIANHVVFVLFGGGIRNQESVDQLFLATQGGPSGNIMPNMLAGATPTDPMSLYEEWTPAGAPLTSQGTLFRNMRYASGPTGHYNGHTVAMTGNYTETGLTLNVNPQMPTIFEYYRKHSDPGLSALNAWWMSIELGPYPALNYSRHPQYGPQYGANYLMPDYGAGDLAADYFGTLQALHPEEVSRIGNMRSFLDGNFGKEPWDLPGIRNTDEDRLAIQKLYLDVLNGTNPMEWPLPPGIPDWKISGDGVNIAASWKVLQEFKPELMVVNTTNCDVAHDNTSLAIQQIYKADYAVGWLWQKIQSDPVLANDTIMICMPEHGRNLEFNHLTDDNGLRATDHTNDENSRDIFGLIVGPPDKVVQGQVVGAPTSNVGESIDIVPTIARILGFDDRIPSGMLPGRFLNEAFV